jgi:hypothetical protein
VCVDTSCAAMCSCNSASCRHAIAAQAAAAGASFVPLLRAFASCLCMVAFTCQALCYTICSPARVGASGIMMRFHWLAAEDQCKYEIPNHAT